MANFFYAIAFVITSLIILPSAQSFCTHGSVRLVGFRNSGRVEVCNRPARNRGSWGTVCDDSFGRVDAGVVCSQLGFSDQGAVVLTGGIGYSTGLFQRIYLDEVACSGTEDSIFDCHANPIGTHNCNHREDVGVRCRLNSRGDIRLRGRRTATSGRVEVFSGTSWGTVCDDFWSINDAKVACRQLGFFTRGATPLTSGIGYRQLSWSSYSSVPIVLDDLLCTGSERKLYLCPNRGIGVHNCHHSEDAGVRCMGALQEITSQEMDKDKLFQEAMAEEADKGAQGVQKEDVMDQEEGTVTTDSEPAKDMLADNGASYSEMLRALKQILLEEK